MGIAKEKVLRHRMRTSIETYDYRVWSNGVTCTIEGLDRSRNPQGEKIMVGIAPDKPTADTVIYHLNIALAAMKTAEQELNAGIRLAEGNGE